MKIIGKIIWVVLVGIVCLNSGVGWAVAIEKQDAQPEGATGMVVEADVYIKAVNPGFTVDGKSNVGEMIEITRTDKGSDAPILLAGIMLRYTNSSGNDSILWEFPEHSYMTGESIVLRLASAPDSELANLQYSKTIAMKAGLALVRGEKILDTACWTGKEGCSKEFVSSNPTFLVRNAESGEFEHLKEYEPKYEAESYKIEEEKAEEEGFGEVTVVSRCRELEFSEILSYYETVKTEQFIEMRNAGSEQVLLDGCFLRYKNKQYALTGIVKPEEYFVYYPTEFNLTKNPTNANTLEIIDVDERVVDTLVYPNGQRKGTAYAWIGYDEKGERLWKVTYAPTPGAPNNYQEYKTCEEGKVINEATGNCVKVTAITEKICPEGQYLNLLTGRCKKNEVTTEKTCKEGYYLNPETGRCRKIVENKGADYSVEPEKFEEKSSFVALYAVAGVVGVGMVYLIYEFRHEIQRLWRKVWR